MVSGVRIGLPLGEGFLGGDARGLLGAGYLLLPDLNAVIWCVHLGKILQAALYLWCVFSSVLTFTLTKLLFRVLVRVLSGGNDELESRTREA